VVEHRLAKARVASSSLVSRSKKSKDEGGRMKDESFWLSRRFFFILPPSSFAFELESI
jgi:hypothetical protein